MDHDTMTEHFPLAPGVIAIGRNSDILGARFCVMEHLEGPLLDRSFPSKIAPEGAHRLCENLIGLHAELRGIAHRRFSRPRPAVW